MRSTTERSTRWLKGRGFDVEYVEKWVTFPGVKVGARPGVRRDVWGCDLLAVSPESRPLLVQTTSKGNVSHRQRKLEGIPQLRLWLVWARVQVHGWFRSTATNKWHVVALEMLMRDGVIRWDETATREREDSCQKD